MRADPASATSKKPDNSAEPRDRSAVSAEHPVTGEGRRSAPEAMVTPCGACPVATRIASAAVANADTRVHREVEGGQPGRQERMSGGVTS